MRIFSRLLCSPALLFLVCMATPSLAQTLNTVYDFCAQQNCADGALPHAGLVQGADGNFYGTTSQGAAGDGTVFKISPSGVLTTLHSFFLRNGWRRFVG